MVILGIINEILQIHVTNFIATINNRFVICIFCEILFAGLLDEPDFRKFVRIVMHLERHSFVSFNNDESFIGIISYLKV